MNIGYISNVVYPFVTGGAEKRIYEIGTRLAERGDDVTVYGRHYWEGPPAMQYAGLQLRAVCDARDLYVGDRRSISEAIEFATALAKPLRRHIDEHDVLVASVFPYFPVFTAAAIARVADIPLVTTWHECWRGYWREYLGALGIAGIAVERAVAALPQTPVAVSSVTADRLAEIGPDRDQIHVVPNGIDVEQVQTTTPVDDGFDILFVGRLIETKNVEWLLQAFEGLAPDTTLGIIGEGPHGDALKRLAGNLGIESRVQFLGFLEAYDDVLRQMRAAAVFVTPSTREGFGITLVEALAAGCTVVAVEHPQTAASEILGDAGLLVDPSVESLQAGIQQALAGWTPREDPIERATRYDWDAITEATRELLQKTIDSD